MAHDELTPGEAALIEEYEALLADPSLWADVPAELEERVVDAITAEAAGATTGWYTYERPSRARRWLATAGAAAVGAAAAAAIMLVVTHDSSRSPDAVVALAGTDLAPGVAGTAGITAVASGVKIELAVPGLPRRDGGEFYQVWLKNCDGSQLVPAGSFHELDRAVAWAGVAPADYPLLTVTKEVVAPPQDAAQGSSGEVVLKGAVGECPI